MLQKNCMADNLKRLPSTEKQVSAITNDDIRVGIIGTVLDKQGERIVVDDGPGKAEISLKGEPNISAGQFVRVLGRVMPVEGGFELQGEVVQDMAKLDMGLLKKVRALEQEAGL